VEIPPVNIFPETSMQARRSSAIAGRPRDAPCQFKSCQMLHSCTKNHIWKDFKSYLS